MIVNKRCLDCGKEMPMYHNASRCYNCAMRHKMEYDRRRRNILRIIKKEHYYKQKKKEKRGIIELF